MVVIYERMLKKRQQLEHQICKIKNRLQKLPEGKLVCNLNGANSKWFRSDGHNKVYIPKSDRQLAEKLAIKKYLSSLLEDLLHEEKAIDFYLRHHENYEEKAGKLLSNSTEIANLISPYFSPLSKELDDWMKSPYENNLIHPEHLKHKVSANESVRSKSEAIIAKELKHNKIPYHYEDALILDEMKMYPDFTIRHPKTGEYFYWEHFGLLDNPKYVESMHKKMRRYTENNIMPGINLITTYETKDNPLTFEMVEFLVEYYFL